MKQLTLVDVRSALNLVAMIVRWLSLAYLLPLGAALYYGEQALAYAVPLVVSAALGWLGERLTHTPRSVGVREGFLVVALAWLAIAAFGALPYLWFGHSFVDAYFESMSGFTTTGSSILTNIEAEPQSLLLWRAFTQWLGDRKSVV